MTILLKENHVYIEKVRALRSQFIYTDVMMNMNILSVVTPLSIYRGCSTLKTFWEEQFTVGEFSAVNMKIVVVTMLGKTEISRLVISTSPWTSCLNLAVWTR